MGLFSSSYKYIAHAGSSPLFDEDDRPESVKSAIVQKAVAEDPPTNASIIRFALATDMYARGKAVMKYAAKHYTYGFPETSEELVYVDQDVVQTVIETEVGEPITISQIDAGQAQQSFLLDQWLQANYMNTTHFPWPAGDPQTTYWSPDRATVEIPVENPSATPPETYYYADNSPSYYHDVTYLPPDDSGEPPLIIDNGWVIDFDYTDDQGVAQTWRVAGTIDLDQASEVITVTYTRDSTPDVTEYWTYEIGSNVHPSIEQSITRSQLDMNFMPVIILMHDQVWFDESGNQELIDTTEGICKRLNLDPVDIKEDYIEQVQEDIESGDRPGKKKLDEWDFFIQFAAPIHAEERGTQEYLHLFFQQLENTQVTSRSSYETNISNASIPYSSLKVTEGGKLGYNVEYRWAYIETVTHDGIFIRPDGEELGPNRMFSRVYKYGDADYAEGIQQVHGAGAVLAPAGVGEDNEDLHHYIVLTRQHKDEERYTQVIMMAPSMQYTVNTRADPNKKGEYRDRYVEVELFPEDPEEDSEFRWPIHFATLKEVGVIRREQVLAESFCATVYLVEKQEVKWYQKGFFKWLIIIIAVILIVLSIFFPGFAAAAAFLLTSALGGGLLMFYIIYSILMFAIGIMIAMAGQLIGGFWGTVFMVIGTIVTMQAGLAGAPGGPGWGISTGGTSGFGSAVSLLQSTAPYIKGGMDIYSAYQMQELQEKMEDFAELKADQQRELDRMFDLLGDGGQLDPMYLLTEPANDMLFEHPDSYYSRTLNANPGLIGYDLIDRFTDIALMLPEEPGNKNIVDGMMNDFRAQQGAA